MRNTLDANHSEHTFYSPKIEAVYREILTSYRTRAANINFEEYEFTADIESFGEWTGDNHNKMHRVITFKNPRGADSVTHNFTVKFSKGTSSILWAKLTSPTDSEKWLSF
jgi:hypothetical protein